MTPTSSRISLLFSIIAISVTVLVAALAGASPVILLVLAITGGVGFYLVFRLILHFTLYKGLEAIWANIKSHRKGKSQNDPYDDVFQPRWIDHEIRYLLKEKTEELARLREIEKFRKDFLGNVAHELRTPVFGIQGYLHTLIDGAADDPAIRDRFLAKAARNADNLTVIIEDLITISRIESNEVRIERTTFDMVKLVEEVFESMEYQANNKGINLIRKGLESAYIFADLQKIRQVLTNLISNSIKYGKDGGQTIVNLFDMRDMILIEVADNGQGIGKEDLPRIFERFYRADKNRARSHGVSTGLGLSIVKHFVEAHRQEVKARSSLGNGTVFSFPLKKSKEKSKQLKINNRLD